ncbi:MAG TPA: hypothetical protein VIX82_13550 [Solirubrobacteraceae bacterium]
MGGVALPHLVGEGGLEADEGGLRALLRLRGDLAVAFEDAPDGGHGGDVREAEAEVVGEGVRPVVVAGVAEFVAQLEDGGLDVRWHRVGAGLGAARAWRQGFETAPAIALDELVDPALRDAGAASDLAATAPLEDDRLHHIALHTHHAPSCPDGWPLCPEIPSPAGGHYVVKPDTPGRATVFEFDSLRATPRRRLWSPMESPIACEVVLEP